MLHLKELERNFDDSSAEAILRVDVGDIYTPLEVVSKSLYNFALDTPEGLVKLIELLPVLSQSILANIYTELFVGYASERLNARQMALELKGFILDVLSETKRTTDEE